MGRNSDILINEDVYSFAGNQDLADITSEIEDIQRALTEGEFDPNLAFQPTSSGPTAAGQDPNTDEPASDGGNLSFTVFDLTADEVVPQAGAETIGVTADFMDPDIPTTPPEGDLLPTTPTQTPTTPTQTPTTPTETPTTPTQTPTTPTETPTTPTSTPTTPTSTPTTPDDDDDDNGQQYEGIEAEDDGGLVDDFDVPQPTETY